MKPLLALLTLSIITLSALAALPAGISLDVDAREISRSLLHARLEIPAKPGEFVLWYPKWIPGVHAPAGPVQNLAGIRFEGALEQLPARAVAGLLDVAFHLPLLAFVVVHSITTPGWPAGLTSILRV